MALLRLTGKGRHVLDLTDQLTSDKERGGMDHELAKDQMAIFLDSREGWDKIKKEKEDINISAERKGKRVGFEIETGKSNYLRNIFRDLKLDCDIVVVVALSSKVKKEIRKKLTVMEDSGIDFRDKVFVLGRWEVEHFVRKYLE